MIVAAYEFEKAFSKENKDYKFLSEPNLKFEQAVAVKKPLIELNCFISDLVSSFIQNTNKEF